MSVEKLQYLAGIYFEEEIDVEGFREFLIDYEK